MTDARKAPVSALSIVARTAGGVVAAAVVGSILTTPNSRWYRSLRKPGWKPPDWVIPVAWTTIYTDLAATSSLAQLRARAEGDDEQAASLERALWTNLAINAGWSALFFRAHNLPVATLGAAALAASSADLTRRTAEVHPAAGAALVPYPAWCTFATALTASIWRRNR